MQRICIQAHQDSKTQCDKEDVGYLTGNFCIDYILKQWFSDIFSKIKYIMKSDFASLFIFFTSMTCFCWSLPVRMGGPLMDEPLKGRRN